MKEYCFVIDKKRIPNNVIVIVTNSRCNQNIIYADHKKAFDKLSGCPIMLPIPDTEKESNYFYSKLKLLGTKQGYELSNSYDFGVWIDSYKEIR